MPALFTHAITGSSGGASVSCRSWGYGNEVWGNSACPANFANWLPLPRL